MCLLRLVAFTVTDDAQKVLVAHCHSILNSIMKYSIAALNTTYMYMYMYIYLNFVTDKH